MFDVNNDVRNAPKLQPIPLKPQAMNHNPHPFWDDKSLREYCRKHCHTTVDEFCDLLLEECEKLDREEALLMLPSSSVK